MSKKSVPQSNETPAFQQVGQPQQITVTKDNAPMLTVHFLQQIYARLGYMIKLLEAKGK